jgi:hypothetical protein
MQDRLVPAKTSDCWAEKSAGLQSQLAVVKENEDRERIKKSYKRE